MVCCSTAGEAARPARFLATAVTGIAVKNRKKVPVATTQSTRMPVRIRLIRKRTMFIWSGPSAGRERLVNGLVALLADQDGIVELVAAALAALARALAAGEDPLSSRVDRVPDAVTKQVQRQRSDQQRDCGEHDVPPGDHVELLRLGQDVAPAWRGLGDPDAEEGQGRLERPRGGV